MDGGSNQTHLIIFRNMSLIKNIEQNIKEATLELTTPEYVEFMRELSVWAENEANVAEYEPDFEIDE